MSQYGPQAFEIQLSDTYRTFNPADPLVGIEVTAVVPITIQWNLGRTELIPRVDLGEKDVTFAPTRWHGAGAGPHDVYAIKVGDRTEKIGTIVWSVTCDFYKEVQSNGGRFRWLITPNPILLRTFTPIGGSPQITEILKQPVPCPGNWLALPKEVQQSVAESLQFTAQMKEDVIVPTRHKLSFSTKSDH